MRIRASEISTTRETWAPVSEGEEAEKKARGAPQCLKRLRAARRPGWLRLCNDIGPTRPARDTRSGHESRILVIHAPHRRVRRWHRLGWIIEALYAVVELTVSLEEDLGKTVGLEAEAL